MQGSSEEIEAKGVEILPLGRNQAAYVVASEASRAREIRYEARGGERRRKATVSRNANRRTPSCLPGHRYTPLLRPPPSRSSSGDAGADTVPLGAEGTARAFLSLSIGSSYCDRNTALRTNIILQRSQINK